MTTITIPKEIAKNKDLIAIPRNIYEDFLAWQKRIKSVKTFTLTVKQKKILEKSREELKKGNYLTIDELKHKLGFKN
ncbi:MAG: hypothetical protein WC587_03605 [Candidatus Paceibacterota bacterium]